MISLAHNWKNLLKKAWSIRLMLLAGLLTACEAILPMYADDIPRGIFAGVSLVVIFGAMLARLVVQQELNYGRRKSD